MRRMERGIGLMALGLIGVLASSAWAAPVTISVSLVSNELEVRPVPKHAIEVRIGESVVQSASTGLDGMAMVDLPPGNYELHSVQPITFQGTAYSWEEALTVGKDPLRVELSTDNAKKTSGTPTGGGADAAAVFQKVERGVVTVESEIAHGTGFLVDASGLILTNDHVIGGSRYFVAEFDPSTRYRAVVVTSDVTADLAIIAVHPDVVKGLPVIPLAKDSVEQPAAEVGETVFAIGSPFNQSKIITTGIVSKNEAEAIISDTMIKPGNSGGPMLNAHAAAIGVNTFRDMSGGESGASGTVRIWKATALLAQALGKMPDIATLSSEKLPTYPEGVYPVEALRDIVMAKEFDLGDYTLGMRRFDLRVLTPPAMSYVEHENQIEAAKGRGKRRDKDKVESQDVFDPLGDLRAWKRYVGDLKPIVRVAVVPKMKATIGSSIGAALLGAPALLRYEYRADFDTIRLFNNGKVVQPIRVGRMETEAVNLRTTQGRMQDVAYGGFVDYLPEAFYPNGGEVYFEVFDEDDPGKARIEKLPKELQDRVREDFKAMESK
jgi:S1-C subfamily serine protease